MPLSTRTSILVLISLFLCVWVFAVTRYPHYFPQSLNVWAAKASNVYYPRDAREGSNTTRDLPRILLWTPFYGAWIGALGSNAGTREVVTSACTPACLLTNDRTHLNSSDAIVFHVRDIDMNGLPGSRWASQKWVFWSMEPPPYSLFPGFRYMANMFNWTMSYRFDSDVFVPYGRLTKTGNVSVEKDHKELWRSKSEMAVWMVSHCDTDGRREAYVEELKKHMSLHVYGLCGSHTCPQSKGSACYHEFERKYFFMLAFENSLCRDYVTEKFFTALKYDMVPVVFGDANYSRLAPPGSYIDALSFATPRDLAQHLHSVAKDFQVYRGYFEWKARHKIVSWVENFCDLCSKLHGEDYAKRSSYADMFDWWGQEGRCRAWKA